MADNSEGLNQGDTQETGGVDEVGVGVALLMGADQAPVRICRGDENGGPQQRYQTQP